MWVSRRRVPCTGLFGGKTPPRRCDLQDIRRCAAAAATAAAPAAGAAAIATAAAAAAAPATVPSSLCLARLDTISIPPYRSDPRRWQRCVCHSLHGSHELAPKPPSGCASLRTAAPAAGRAPALLQYGLADKVRGPQPARSGSSYRPIGARASATDDRSIPQPTLPTAVGTSATRLLLASVADALKRPAHCCTAAIHSACWQRD